MSHWAIIRRYIAHGSMALVMLSALCFITPILGFSRTSESAWEISVEAGFYMALLALVTAFFASGTKRLALIVMGAMEAAFWFFMSVGL